MTKKRVMALLAIATYAVTCYADEITIQGLPYANVTVNDVKDCEIVFRTANREVRKPLDQVDRIQLRGRDAFNAAEELLNKKSFAEAEAAYTKLLTADGSGWMDRLVHIRLLRAQDGAGRVFDATGEWLGIAMANKACAVSLALRPRNLPPKGSPDNARAVDLLKARKAEANEAALRTAINQLLLDLFRQEGRDEEAVALAEEMSGKRPPSSTVSPKPTGYPTATTSTGPPSSTTEIPAAPAPESGSSKARFDAADVLLQNGNAEKVLHDIDLNAESDATLPEALILVARAQVQLAQKAGDAQKKKSLLCEAGLNFMRVSVFYGSSSKAAEALYNAAVVSQALGNTKAMNAAYQQIVDQYAKSPFAEKARAALQAGQQRP